MTGQRAPLSRRRVALPRQARAAPVRAGLANYARPASSEIGDAWSACLLRSPSSHDGSRDTTFVAGSEKVTFYVKYSGLRPQNPADELCDGPARVAA